MNILVIDDSEDIRYLLSKTLPIHADVDEVRTAADGSEAMDVCTEFRPDMVITDCRMAGPAPEDTSRRIRDMFPDVQIVAFSGMPEKHRWADVEIQKGHEGLAALHNLLTTDG